MQMYIHLLDNNAAKIRSIDKNYLERVEEVTLLFDLP